MSSRDYEGQQIVTFSKESHCFYFPGLDFHVGKKEEEIIFFSKSQF